MFLSGSATIISVSGSAGLIFSRYTFLKWRSFYLCFRIEIRKVALKFLQQKTLFKLNNFVNFTKRNFNDQKDC